MFTISGKHFTIIYHPADEDGFLICHPTGQDWWALPSGKFPESDGKISPTTEELLFMSRYFKCLTGISTDGHCFHNVASLDCSKEDEQTFVFFYNDMRREDHCGVGFYPSNPSCRLTLTTPTGEKPVYDGFKYILLDDARKYLDEANLQLLELAFKYQGRRFAPLKCFKDSMLRARIERDRDIPTVTLSTDEQAVFEAVKDSGELQRFAELIGKGVDVNAKDGDGYTALYRCSSPDKAKLLLKAGANPNLICHDQGLFESPLHRAVRAHNTELVKVMVEGGADLFYHDGRGMTPLDVVREMNSDEMAAHETLYFNDTPRSKMKNDVVLNEELAKAMDDIGNFPYGQVEALLREGADPYARVKGGPSIMQTIDDCHRETTEIKDYFRNIDKDIDI